ncbi:EARP-interacting protein homolog [Musca domestica]|uniref:EARP-interacting protein homolog n=1 Tax=Musca domestica TaxID=7370 RepID=A0A1I8MEP6_MUSDO|nr:EARP-interacting protein homolog [Musca domestica]XP_058984357.1 EARP-interacting protein homolog [Musca domestica]
MDESNGQIYGLELQARSLASQLGETQEIRFFIATNSLKPSTNQVHLVEYSEEQSNVKANIFEHPMGEVWKITANPHDIYEISTCYNEQNGNSIRTRASLLKYSDDIEDTGNLKSEYRSWHTIETLNTLKYGDKVKCIEFHPAQKEKLACVVDNKIILFDRVNGGGSKIAELTTGTSTKHISPLNGGKWSHHHQCQQFVALHDTSVKAYDIRDQHLAWSIEDAHGQFVRDIDCNPNKQCHFVTGGDDGFIKIWDCRMPKEPVFMRNDHSHWVWSVRFNTFHDQLVLSSSSDCKVLLTCASSVSSEAPELGECPGRVLSDGLLQTFEQHEDSVYCVEWSNVDPWIFASLSYDGRLLISKVPKQYKYQIIL